MNSEYWSQHLNWCGLEGNTCLDDYKQQISIKMAWSLWTVWIVKELHLETKLFIVNCFPSSSSKWSHISVFSAFSNKTKQSGAVPLPQFHSHAIKFTTSMHLSVLGKYMGGQYLTFFLFPFPSLSLSKATHTPQWSYNFLGIIEKCQLQPFFEKVGVYFFLGFLSDKEISQANHGTVGKNV